MSPTTLDNNVVELLRKSSGATSLRPNTGEGFQGKWPPDGDCDLWVLGISASMGSIEDSTKAKVPCAAIQFRFETAPNINDPDYKPTDRFEFDGEQFRLYPPQEIDNLKISDGYKKALAGNWERFLGHCSVLLSIDEQSLKQYDAAQLVTQVSEKLTGARVAVRARIRWKETASKKPGGSAYVNKTEYLVENISA